MLDKFLDLLKESVIMQAVLTIMIWGTICYLFLAGRTVPDLLVWAGTTILGVFFGAKMQNYANRVS